MILQLEGDNNTVTVPEPVYNLSKNSDVVEAVKTIVSPVADEIGIEEAVFLHEGQVTATIDKSLASDLQQVYADTEESLPQVYTAHIVIHAPVLEPRCKH